MRLIARPIDVWPGEMTPESARSNPRFTAAWSDTLDLLDREVGMLARKRDVDVVMQMALRERDCRRDGGIRADARPAHPGVIISFDSRHGPLRYATDQFTTSSVWISSRLAQARGEGPDARPRSISVPGWQSNVRAIALGLEALRTVDRYGISRAGEQYRGWQALPPGTSMPAAKMTLDEAARILHTWSQPDSLAVPWETIRDDPDTERVAYRTCAKRHHPDQGGNPDVWRQIDEAHRLLSAHA